MAPPPRNKRNKKRKQKAGPPAGAVEAAKRNAEAASEPADVVDEVSLAAATLEDREVPPSTEKPPTGKSSRKRAAETEADARDVDAEPDTGVEDLEMENLEGDEYESEEEEEEEGATTEERIFRPGVDKLNEGETLVCDETAYDTLQQLTVDWPAMTVDAVGVGTNGEYTNMGAVVQRSYPLSATIVMGTCASEAKKNSLTYVRLTNMQRTGGKRRRKKLSIGADSDSDSDISEDEASAGAMGGAAALQSAHIKHDGIVNRVRVMPQRAHIVAAWGETGRVSLYDATPALDALHRDNVTRMAAAGRKTLLPSSVRPFYAYTEHRVEGYAMDWSRVNEGRLATGACNGSIYLCEPDGGGARWCVASDRFRGHRGSVEDVQWSPSEATVFGSVGVDKTLRFWDTRNYRKPALTVPQAHDADVNVLSWNRREAHLVATGGDDGTIRVWDLRALQGGAGEGSKSEATAAADFRHHTKPITGVQWHEQDASMLVASSEDGTVTVWDLAVERDAEEELREGIVVKGADEYPPQLLFLHMGQKNVKDVLWHPSCSSLLVSTAEDGLNVFKPANITLPQQ